MFCIFNQLITFKTIKNFINVYKITFNILQDSLFQCLAGLTVLWPATKKDKTRWF